MNKSEYKEKIIKAVEKINSAITFREAFPRVVEMFAITIDNQILYNEDEKAQKNRKKTYQDNLRYLGDTEKVNNALSIISEAIINNPYEDILGELYIGKSKGNKHLGQTFTPSSISKLMAIINIGDSQKIKEQINEMGYLEIVDEACGSGSLTLGTAKVINSYNPEYLTKTLFHARDIDTTVAMMCYIQLSLNGLMAEINIGNSLAPMDSKEYIRDTWCTPALKIGALPSEELLTLKRGFIIDIMKNIDKTA